jgi:hypothetical protein
VNNENKQGKKERKKEKRKDQSRKTERAQALESRGVGCNLGGAGDGFLCDVPDGLVTLS